MHEHAPRPPLNSLGRTLKFNFSLEKSGRNLGISSLRESGSTEFIPTLCNFLFCLLYLKKITAKDKTLTVELTLSCRVSA